MGMVERILSLGRKGKAILGSSDEDRWQDPFKKLREKPGVTIRGWARRRAKDT